MITIIDNNQRIFRLSVDTMHGIDIFCNMKDIPKVIQNLKNDGHGNFKVYEFWNRKFKLISKKKLNDYLEANNIIYNEKT